MNAPRDQRWILRSRALLDQRARDIDTDTLRRLNQIRLQALKTRRKPAVAAWGRWAGAAAAAAALATVLVLARFGLPQAGTPPLTATDPAPMPIAAEAPPADAPAANPVAAAEVALSLPATDLELLQQESDYALLEELEFYAWLEAAEHEG